MLRLMIIVLAAALASGQAQAEDDWVRPELHSIWLVYNATAHYKDWPSLPGMQVELYSQNRPSKKWGPFTPALYHWTGQTITCQRGEYICFGAWSEGDASASEWGTGRDNHQRCTARCAYCDESVKLITLYRFGGTYDLRLRPLTPEEQRDLEAVLKRACLAAGCAEQK